MTSTPKQHPIKALTNFRRMSAEDVATTSDTIQSKFNNNPSVTGGAPLPVDLPTVKAATDLLRTKIAAAADGGKTAVAEKNHQKEVVVKLLIQLAHYAEANCKDDMTTFLSFGFTAAASTKNTTPPASDSIRKVETGPNSGEMLIALMKYPGAVSYVLQWAVLGAGGVPGLCASKPVATLKQPTLVAGLTPGSTYLFQARALTKTGYTDFGESITRIAV